MVAWPYYSHWCAIFYCISGRRQGQAESGAVIKCSEAQLGKAVGRPIAIGTTEGTGFLGLGLGVLGGALRATMSGRMLAVAMMRMFASAARARNHHDWDNLDR